MLNLSDPLNFFLTAYVIRVETLFGSDYLEMQMNKTLLAAALCLSTLFGSVSGMPAQAQRVISGHIAKERVTKLSNEIKWHTRLSDAQAEAAREGKLILWVHMLGEIDGAT
jgi:hypothetical protein